MGTEQGMRKGVKIADIQILTFIVLSIRSLIEIQIEEPVLS